MELKDILIQDPPLLRKPRGSTSTHYSGHGYGKAVSCRSTHGNCTWHKNYPNVFKFRLY